MAPTLRDLCRRVGDDLAPHGDVASLDVPVSAVHVSELANPADYLEGGELLLTTGLRVPLSVAGCAKYVERLRSADAAGLGLGIGPRHGAVPEVLAEECARAGLPFFTVPRPTPFVRISRAFWRLVVTEEQQQTTAVLGAHRDLVAATLAKHPSQGVLRRLARETGGWAAHLSVDGMVHHVWPPEAEPLARGLTGEVRRLRGGGMRAASTFELDGYDVVIQPVTGRNSLYGFLAAGSNRQRDQGQRQLLLMATALLAVDSERVRQLRAARRQEHWAVITLLRHDLHAAGRLLASEQNLPFPTGQVRCVLIDCEDPSAVLDLLEEHSEGRRRTLLPAVVDGCAFFLLPGGRPSVEWLRRQLPVLGPAVAVVGGPTTLDRLTEELARLARAVDERRGTGPLLHDMADPGGSLVERLGDPAVREWARSALAPLEQEGRSDLVDTLAAYLRFNCEYERAARHLGVHRHTMRSRVQGIVTLLDRDLEDAEVRAELWFALRLLGRV